MKQKTIHNTDLSKLDSEANTFEDAHNVKFVQSYCGTNENGALVHVRVLLYELKKMNPIDAIDAEEKPGKKAFNGVKIEENVIDTSEPELDDLDELEDLVPKEKKAEKVTMEEINDIDELDDM